jgi:hypothetical protein
MQSSEIRSSKVVARFFVALVSKCIQNKWYLFERVFVLSLCNACIFIYFFTGVLYSNAWSV